MNRLILLDTGPLSLATNPRASDEARGCKTRLRELLEEGTRVLVPEIADYEQRRELLRAGRGQGVERLDELARILGYLPIATATWRRASELWAQARLGRYQTAADPALDGDVLLAAQAQLAAESGFDVTVLTNNVRHLERFVNAARWDSLREPAAMSPE